MRKKKNKACEREKFWRTLLGHPAGVLIYLDEQQGQFRPQVHHGSCGYCREVAVPRVRPRTESNNGVKILVEQHSAHLFGSPLNSHVTHVVSATAQQIKQQRQGPHRQVLKELGHITSLLPGTGASCSNSCGHYPSRYGNLMTFFSLLFSRPINDGYQNSER